MFGIFKRKQITQEEIDAEIKLIKKEQEYKRRFVNPPQDKGVSRFRAGKSKQHDIKKYKECISCDNLIVDGILSEDEHCKYGES